MRPMLKMLVTALLVTTPAATLAHHSFVAEYDRGKPVKMTGTVTKVEWQNPHIWFYVDVKDDAGKVVNWGVLRRPARRTAAAGHLPQRHEGRRRGHCAGVPRPGRIEQRFGRHGDLRGWPAGLHGVPEDARPEGGR